MGLTAEENMDGLPQAANLESVIPVSKPDADYSDDESDYSEDGDGVLRSLYSTLPEDLGFTLLGLDFAESDLRIMRRLRLDLDTFMSLSESELIDIGIKESVKIKRHITKNVQGKQIFNKPKKSLKLTQEEMRILGSSLAGQISELNVLLTNVNINVNINKPANFREYEGFSSLEIFQAACATVLKQAKETRNCLESLSRTIGFTAPGMDSTENQKRAEKKIRRKKIIEKTLLFASGSLCIYFAVKKLVLPSISLRK